MKRKIALTLPLILSLSTQIPATIFARTIPYNSNAEIVEAYEKDEITEEEMDTYFLNGLFDDKGNIIGETLPDGTNEFYDPELQEKAKNLNINEDIDEFSSMYPDAQQENGFYVTTDGTLVIADASEVITKVTNGRYSVVIPTRVKGITVTKLGDPYWLEMPLNSTIDTRLIDVYIPSTITSVGSSVYYYGNVVTAKDYYDMAPTYHVANPQAGKQIQDIYDSLLSSAISDGDSVTTKRIVVTWDGTTPQQPQPQPQPQQPQPQQPQSQSQSQSQQPQSTSKRIEPGFEVTVFINGSTLESDVPARIVNSRAFVPLRAIAESLGCQVSYNSATGESTVSKNGTDVTLKTYSNDIKITKNGTTNVLTFDTAPINIDNRIMVPVRIVAEATGATVEWESSNYFVYITE